MAMTERSFVESAEKKYRFGFNGKENDEDLGGQDYGARIKHQERFSSIDAKSIFLASWSPYVFCLNSPLYQIDIDGNLPWPIHIRSFIHASNVGGGFFRGDGRNPSTKDFPEAWSRVKSSFVIDPSNGAITKKETKGDPTVFYGVVSSTRLIPPLVENPEPIMDVIAVKSENNEITCNFYHYAKDPVTPSWVTPDLDLKANLTITENLEKGLLGISGIFSGDAFPSTEAFIEDQSGKRLLLGAHKEEGSINMLFGENSRTTITINFHVKLDKNGNFTEVKTGDKTYSIEEWNKKITTEFEKNE
jgi:RHS repeat-associated protein